MATKQKVEETQETNSLILEKQEIEEITLSAAQQEEIEATTSATHSRKPY